METLSTWGYAGTGYRNQEGHNFLYIGLSDNAEFPYIFESITFPSYKVAGKTVDPGKIETIEL